MNEYEEKQEARRARLLAAAAKSDAVAAQAFDKADLREEVSGIPLGQPILVDHHSASRHRRIIARADAAMRKGIEADARAAELRSKAAGVGTGGISSQDPDAAEKIGEEIARLEAKQSQMKAANAAIRKHKAEGASAQVAALVALWFAEDVAAKLIVPDSCGRIGFPDYALQNNSANIRRLKARIPRVVASQSVEQKIELIGAIEYREEDARVWLIFPGKPSDEIRAELRSHGFKWSPTRGAWVRHLSEAARYYARKIAGKAEGSTA